MTENTRPDIRWQVKDITKENKASGTYYTVDLPPGIADLHLATGDYAKLNFESQEVPMYVYGEKSEEDGYSPDEYKIHGSENASELTVPKEFSGDFIEEPVYQLVVEINEKQGTPHLRLYHVEEYFQIRVPELKNEGYDVGPGEPLAISLFNSKNVYQRAGGTKVVDFVAGTPWDGQEFRIVPFDAQHKVFGKIKKETMDGSNVSSHDVFQKVLRKDRIPKCQIQKLKIGWSLEHSREYSGDTWTRRKGNLNKKYIYTVYIGRGINMVLPCIGEFVIVAETKYGANGTMLTYSPAGGENHDRLIGGNWYTKYHEIQSREKEYVVYVPCYSREPA